jgi:hypothetical protein
MSNRIMTVRSLWPHRVGKSYKLQSDGALLKKTIARIERGEAYTHEIENVQEMAALIAKVSETDDTVLCLSSFTNLDQVCAANGLDPLETPITIVTSERLKADLAFSTTPPGIHCVGGKRLEAARLKIGMTPSKWMLLDADNPEGMPPAWAALDIQKRAELLEPIIPGLSSRERVEYRGSSARVFDAAHGAVPAGRTHALVQVDDPSKIETLRVATRVGMINADLFFKTPHRARADRKTIVGYGRRTVFDLAPWGDGRLIFNARPIVDDAPGYDVAPAHPHIVNPGGGALSISNVTLPKTSARESYEKKTGERIRFSQRNGALYVEVAGRLTLDTPIERRGEIKPLRDWVSTLKLGEKLRCEAPFRESQSEAAFVGLHKNGDAFVYDVGEATKYTLKQSAQDAFDDFDPHPPDDDDDDDDDNKPRGRWAKLQAALQWSGKEKLVRTTCAIAWHEPGIAVFGCGAAVGNAVERRWVSDRHARGYVSVTNGSPAAGKTMLAASYANAIAAEKPLLAGLDRIERAGAVVFIAADGERAEEFQRKDQAFRQYYNLSNGDFRYPVYVFDNVGAFVEKRKDVWVPSLWLIGIAPKLAEMREREKLALVVVDTLLGVSGGGNTADATDMQAIMDIAKMIAAELDCAVEILNHLTKGGAKNNPSDMDAGLERGR